MKPESCPKSNWQYILPCAFFDGPNQSLYEILGWRRFTTNDIISKECNYWSRGAVGSSVAAEKWATERIFLHEELNMLAMTFDFFDNGIAYMIWWIRGDTSRKYGLAVKKITGEWHIVQSDEVLEKEFEAIEIAGIKKILKVDLIVFKNKDQNTMAQSVFSRPK